MATAVAQHEHPPALRRHGGRDPAIANGLDPARKLGQWREVLLAHIDSAMVTDGFCAGQVWLDTASDQWRGRQDENLEEKLFIMSHFFGSV